MSEDREKYPSELKVSTTNKHLRYRRVEGSRRSATPEYSLGAGAPAARPSGDVLVRFAEGTRAISQKSLLIKAGYRITQELAWAENAVLVRASSGELADTLGHIEKLEALPGVENVEPQMIGKRSKR